MKKPAVDDLQRRRETNEYWLAALAGAQTDPRKLEAIRTSVAQLEAVTADDVRREAQAYLVDTRARKLEVRPTGGDALRARRWKGPGRDPRPSRRLSLDSVVR